MKCNSNLPCLYRMEISVVDRRGKARGTYTLAASDTVATLKKQFAAKSAQAPFSRRRWLRLLPQRRALADPKYYVERQWFTYNKAGGTMRSVPRPLADLNS